MTKTLDYVWKHWVVDVIFVWGLTFQHLITLVSALDYVWKRRVVDISEHIFRFLAKDTRFDVATGKEGDKAKKPKRRQRAKSEKEILYMDGIPYKRIPIGPGENFIGNVFCSFMNRSETFIKGVSKKGNGT